MRAKNVVTGILLAFVVISGGHLGHAVKIINSNIQNQTDK